MKARRLAWRPRYEGDEVAVGVALAIALHAIPIALIALKAMLPSLPDEPEEPIVGKPVVAATLLKLGKPIDPRQLPDRLVPQRRTAPKPDIVASREDPLAKRPDAGAPPPPNTDDSDLQNLIAKSEAFAESGKARPEEGHPDGVEEGTETDPAKVRAGDMYAAQLDKFFRDRWQIPTVISAGEAKRLCVVYQISLTPRMTLWHVRNEPVKGSGNELYDDSARSMFLKLIDDKTQLPEPPPAVADTYKGRTLQVILGESSRCK
jgi:hypothetical protein